MPVGRKVVRGRYSNIYGNTPNDLSDFDVVNDVAYANCNPVNDIRRMNTEDSKNIRTGNTVEANRQVSNQ